MSVANLFNRASTKTTAQPSRIRVRQHVIAKKVEVGQHGLTPDRIARITASAKQREYRERQRDFPIQPTGDSVDTTAQGGKLDDNESKDRVVSPIHDLSGEHQVLANAGNPEGAEKHERIADECRAAAGRLVNGKACGDSFIPDGSICRIGESANAASDKANISGTASDHREAEEAHVKAAMESLRQWDNKRASAETRTDAASIGLHQDEAKRHRDAAAKIDRDVNNAQKLVRDGPLDIKDGPMVERINKFSKEMSEAGREYASASANKDSKDPLLKSQHDAAYERMKSAHKEQQSIAAKLAGFDDVQKWFDHRRGKMQNSEAFTNAAVAMESVRRQLGDVIREDPRFKTVSLTPGTPVPSPWVQDLLTPDDDGVWQAILSRPTDGRLVKVGFVFVDGLVTLLPSEPLLVGMEVIYNRDPERLGITVDATDKLLNRFSVPSDGWIHLAPFGKHPHPTGVVQVIDDKSVDAMVANFASRKASDKNFTGALLDFDHFSQSGDKPSEAGGWIENLAKREDGMWGQVRWTDVGEKAVNGGRYRLVSPVWLKRNCETLDNGQLRPLVLDSVALTNEPNLKGLTPISR